MDPILLTIFSLGVLLFSVVIHEIAHGSVALYFGDPTAKLAGRLTLNPLKHLDPFGSVILPLMMLIFTMGQGPIFGWAKPVPVNPFYFRDLKKGEIFVSLAGPLTNISLALIFGLILRFFNFPPEISILFSTIVVINLILAVFNLLPIPPLDGSHVLFALLPPQYQWLKLNLQTYGLFILIFVIFFGLPFLFTIVNLLYRLIVGTSI